MSRAEADRQALAEVYDDLRRHRETAPGIIGELISAVTRCHRPGMQPALATVGLLGRAPLWGIGSIIADGNTYRPAGPDVGVAAIIVPAVEDGLIIDLVAQNISTGRLHRRLDVGAIVGFDEVEHAKAHGLPLLIFNGLPAWLRANTRGAVIADWTRAGAALDGLPAILAPARMVDRIARVTRDCHPRPIVATPHRRGVAHAA